MGDVQSLQVNLQKVLNDLQMADEIGRNAKKTSDIFEKEKVCKEWEAFLLSLCR